MKKYKYILPFLIMCVTVSCNKDFLELNPQGELTEEQLNSQDGVEGLLTGAYALLNGNLNGTFGNYASAPSQWLIGEVASDNAHKGSSNGDQPNMNLIEQHSPTSTNDNLSGLWDRCFEGIVRCNNTLKQLARLQSEGANPFVEARSIEIQAESRLLRAHYYFFLRRVFLNVPYIDENTTEYAVVNDTDIYPNIEADLRFALDNLPLEKPKGQVGRVDKITAQAYLGKVLLYEKKYDEALPLFTSVIASRPNLEGLDYTANFDVTRENGPESIFAVQHGVGADGSGGDNGNVGDILNFPYGNGLPITCCGFFQPSFDLVNSFKTDIGGLPLFDTYRQNPITSDFNQSPAQKAAYQVDKSLTVDPRLDYTVGRRGVPYRDWGVMAGDTWIRDPSNGGPFVPYKNVIEAAQVPSNSAPGTLNVTGLNVNIIRLADVYLMAAECNVELGNLPAALDLVNTVRRRAAQLPPKLISGTPAANYKVAPYTAFSDAAYARRAIQLERRLELAMEGHRFYDLVRWGLAKQTLESYFGFEGNYFSYIKGILFEPRDEYFPIPQDQLDRSQGVLKQNKDY